MDRRKADGTAFEKDFEKFASGAVYVRRLPTLNTGYAGMSQPADFIVVGQSFNYVELKETAGDSFSITAMQQFDEMKEFMLKKHDLRFCKGVKTSNYWIIVHFLKHKSIKMVDGEKALLMSSKRKAIRADDDTLITFGSLDELLEAKIL